MYINLYAKLCKELLALPVIVGQKSEREKFAGAKKSYTIEGFMPDGKALQCGTSHNLGQGFAKSFNISFLGKDGKQNIPWQNSWGISTRLIGGMIMTHSDDKGLVLPPKVAKNKLVIVPIVFGEDKEVIKKSQELKKQLEEFDPLLDDRLEYGAGYKFNEWEMKGIPLRMEIGPRDLKENKVILVRRDNGKKESKQIDDNLAREIKKILDEIQDNLFQKAKENLDNSITQVKDMKELIKAIENKKLALANFCGESACEESIKEKTNGGTTRCIPLDKEIKKGSKCIYCDKAAKHLIYFARSY
jgi:prolyl-tRNA synthetase